MDGSSAWNISWCTGHDPCSSCSTRKTHMIVEPHDYIVPSQNLETGKVLLQVQMISRRCPLASCGMCTKHWSGLGLDLSRVGLTLIVLQVLKSNMIEIVWDWPSGTHAMFLFSALNYLGAESAEHEITTQASLRQEVFRYSSLWNTGMKRLLPSFNDIWAVLYNVESINRDTLLCETDHRACCIIFLSIEVISVFSSESVETIFCIEQLCIIL